MDQRIARSSQRLQTVPHGPSMPLWSEFTLIWGLPQVARPRRVPFADLLPILTLCQRDTSCSQIVIVGEDNALAVLRCPHPVFFASSLRLAMATVGTTCGLISLHHFPISQRRYKQVQRGSCYEMTVIPSDVRLQRYKYPLQLHGTIYSPRHST